MDWQEARAQFAACRRGIAYLNSGTLGLISDRVAAAEAAWNEYAREYGPASPSVLECVENGAQAAVEGKLGGAAQNWEGTNHLSERLADLMHVGDSSMYFTANASDGMARAAASMKWNAGEHLVITDAEHNSVPANARDIQSEHPGVSFSVASVQHLFGQPNFEEKWIEAIVNEVADNTRLVIVGEILWHLGLVMPIRELVKRCKEKNPGIVVMVDGAHGLGQVPVNVQDLGCDVYATAGHTWLCGPGGSGILVVTNEMNDRRKAFRLRIRRAWGEPVSGRRAQRAVDPNWGQDSNPQIDFSAVHQATLVGLGAALDAYEELGVAAVAERVRSLADAAAARLAAVKKVSVLPPVAGGRQTGIVAFSVDGVTDQDQADSLVNQLERQFKVACRWVGDPLPLRACLHYYNNEDDIEALCRGLSALL